MSNARTRSATHRRPNAFRIARQGTGDDVRIDMFAERLAMSECFGIFVGFVCFLFGVHAMHNMHILHLHHILTLDRIASNAAQRVHSIRTTPNRRHHSSGRSQAVLILIL